MLGAGALEGVVGDARTASRRAVGPAQVTRASVEGHRGRRRPQQGRPRALLRQPGGLPGVAAAAEVRPRPAAAVRSVSRPDAGTNTGPGKLPFPTREETILPDNLTADFKTDAGAVGQRRSRSIIAARRPPGLPLRAGHRHAGRRDGRVGRARRRRSSRWPAAASVSASRTDRAVPPEKIELSMPRGAATRSQAAWRCIAAERTAEVQLHVSALAEVAGGRRAMPRRRRWASSASARPSGSSSPRLVTLPYLTGDQPRGPRSSWPAPPESRCSSSALLDYYRSNASSLWAANEVAADGVTYNGGSRYLPKTDGRRNDCFERLFLTVSPRFEEVLPNIPNPKSPWMHVAGERLWRAHGACEPRAATTTCGRRSPATA